MNSGKINRINYSFIVPQKCFDSLPNSFTRLDRVCFEKFGGFLVLVSLLFRLFGLFETGILCVTRHTKKGFILQNKYKVIHNVVNFI
jgi:hypothetical protein